jgi:hypothetical protein
VQKAKNDKKEKQGADIHIKIASPNYLRKQVLALTIESIEIMKVLRAYRENKTSKKKLIEDLKAEVDAIKKLTVELEKHELPMNIKQLNNLPMFKEKRELLEKVEKVREKAEKALEREQVRLEKDIAKGPRMPPAPKPVIEEIPTSLHPEIKDKLEADLASLRDKMAQL